MVIRRRVVLCLGGMDVYSVGRREKERGKALDSRLRMRRRAIDIALSVVG